MSWSSLYEAKHLSSLLSKGTNLSKKNMERSLNSNRLDNMNSIYLFYIEKFVIIVSRVESIHSTCD